MSESCRATQRFAQKLWPRATFSRSNGYDGFGTHSVELESALNILLAPLKLDYVIANDVMMITTDNKTAATLDARVYDLSRLPNLEPKALLAIIMAVTKPDA